MRRALFALVLLAACNPTPTPGPRPPLGNGSGHGLAPPSCAPDGAVIYQETAHDLHPNPPPDQPPSYLLTIRESGAWTEAGTPAGQGCLGAAPLIALGDAIEKASFVATPANIRCHIVPILHTDYQANGKPAMSIETPCGESRTDDATSHAIDCAHKVIQGAACE